MDIKKIFSLVLICASGFAWAQRTPKAESSNDLRHDKELLMIKNYKQAVEYILSSNSSGEYKLKLLKAQKIIKMSKISNGDAEKIDKEFADSFINMKYMMDNNTKKECNKAFTLELRGEEFDICSSEKIKIETTNTVLENITSYF